MQNNQFDLLERIMLNHPDEEFFIMDGFDNAIIGIEENSMRLIYSKEKIIEILMEEMEEIDAQEHYDFNIAGGYVGEKTPIFCNDIF